MRFGGIQEIVRQQVQMGIAGILPANTTIISPADVELLTNIKAAFQLDDDSITPKEYIINRLHHIRAQRSQTRTFNYNSLYLVPIGYHVKQNMVDIIASSDGVLLCCPTIANQMRLSIESGVAQTSHETLQLVRRLVFMNELYLTEYMNASSIITECHSFTVRSPIHTHVVANACDNYAALVRDIYKNTSKSHGINNYKPSSLCW